MTGPAPAPAPAPAWTLLTNHAQVLLCIARDPEARLRDVAERVGITERAAQRIVADLVDAGFLTRHRVGRRNTYEVHAAEPLRHPFDACRSIVALLESQDAGTAPRRTRRTGSARNERRSQ